MRVYIHPPQARRPIAMIPCANCKTWTDPADLFSGVCRDCSPLKEGIVEDVTKEEIKNKKEIINDRQENNPEKEE
jgi:hypothetical protein